MSVFKKIAQKFNDAFAVQEATKGAPMEKKVEVLTSAHLAMLLYRN